MWKFVLDMGSLSHWGLIIAPGQEANGDNLGMSHYENMPIQIYRKFHLQKLKIFR